MLIEIEETLNPNVRNFYFSAPMLAQYQAEYAHKNDKKLSPLMENIFKIGQIEEVLLLPDMLFVKKEEGGDWPSLSPQIMAELVDADFEWFRHFEPQKEKVLKQIEALTESKIRPYLQRDGGNIELIKLENGVLSVKLNGRCHGCPHAAQTFQNAVETTIKKYIKDVNQIKRED